jgi:hypothetical protein
LRRRPLAAPGGPDVEIGDRGRAVNDPFPIIVPSAELAAVVRHGTVPDDVPDPLVAYVRPVVDADGAPVDWLLTEDTLAFADVSVPMFYAQWRATWERSWILDPLSSLERLVSAAREFEVSAPSQTLLERILRPATQGPSGDMVHAELSTDEAQRLAAVIESLRDAVADRGRGGFGFVDATPGRARSGLARAWSGQDGPEVLVADRHVSVAIDAADGLSVTASATAVTLGDGDSGDGTAGDVVSLAAVQEVELGEAGVVVRNDRTSITLDLHHGRVLSWLMPGCMRWRVRPVPEVLVWAKTFAGLVDSAELAVALDRPVTLSSLRLSENDDATQRAQASRPLESSSDQEP